MNTPKKQKQMTQNSMERASYVRAMSEMMINMSQDSIKIPKKYKDQVLSIKETLKNDVSGLVNSLLDFAMKCGLVEYSVETDNKQLTDLFNAWLSNINSDLRGQIPTGISALVKEYLRERWKGSSFLILRSKWEQRDGFIVPTKMWFVNGEDIVIDDKGKETFAIGQEKYGLQVAKNKQIPIPSGKDEYLFVQKPYESWGTAYPTPYLIRRGLYKNMRLLEMLSSKGEYVMSKALEYLLLMKKGTENLALANQADFIYSTEDLKAIKTQMEELLGKRQYTPGVPTYATNFDTEIEHLIPEYTRVLKQELFTPIERRILAGLGLVDVLQGVASTRKESSLNPKPFITEVESGIDDFKMMLNDILETIIKLNKAKHPKYIGHINKIHSTPMSQFISDEIRSQFRSMYDRGVISKQTYVEVVGDVDFVIEVNRRKQETDEIKKVMYPPVVQNQEASPDDPTGKPPENKDTKDDVPDDKTGIEKKNFKTTASDMETSDLKGVPKDIKDKYPESAQVIWLDVFNKTSHKGKEYATKVALSVVKKLYKKDGDEWVLKKKTKSNGSMLDINKATMDDIIQEVLKFKEIEIKNNQLKLLKKLNEESA